MLNFSNIFYEFQEYKRKGSEISELLLITLNSNYFQVFLIHIPTPYKCCYARYGCTRNMAQLRIPLHHHRVLYNAHRVVYLKHTRYKISNAVHTRAKAV